MSPALKLALLCALLAGQCRVSWGDDVGRAKSASFVVNVSQPGGTEEGDPEHDNSLNAAVEQPQQTYEPDASSFWEDQVRVGYDGGFLIASPDEQDLGAGQLPFRMRVNGWGQLRQTHLDSTGENDDVNQFQLKRGRIVFSGNAFTPDFSYFVQLDGRSSSGDDVRLLDYYLTFDLGHHFFELEPDVLRFKTGKYKMPFTLARFLSGRAFEFSDRSVASTFFDVNRSLAWGFEGLAECWCRPVIWEVAIFNGLVTGGAETGSSGTLDNNFAYSARVYSFPIGKWGAGSLADFDHHDELAMRIGAGVANSNIDRSGRTEFESLRVVDSGERLSGLLPRRTQEFEATLFSVDASAKMAGYSLTFEYYFRNVGSFHGARIPQLFDHGFWLQFGKFVYRDKLQLLARWSRVVGNSQTLGRYDKSFDEVAAGAVWYFRRQHAKLTLDVTHLNGAPVNSSALDVFPRDQGILARSQIQFAF